MKTHKRLHLNLATHPSRNRRLFYSLVTLLSVVILVIAVVGGGNFLRYGTKVRVNRQTVRQLEQAINTAKNQEKEFTRKTNSASSEMGKEVEALNGIVYRKSFSWVLFLYALEEVLPDACYITSLAPVFRDDATVDLNFKMVSPDSENFYTLLERIVERGGRNVRLIREDRDERGNFVFEIAVIYARDN